MKIFEVIARNVRGTTSYIGVIQAPSLEAALKAWAEAWLGSYGSQYAPKVDEVSPGAYCGSITLHATRIIIDERAAADAEVIAATQLPLPTFPAETT